MFSSWLESMGHRWLKRIMWRPSDGPAVVFPMGPLAGYVVPNAAVEKQVCRRFAVAVIADCLLGTIVPICWFGFRAMITPDVVLLAVALLAYLVTVSAIVVSLPRLPRETSVAAYFEWRDLDEAQDRRNQGMIFSFVSLLVVFPTLVAAPGAINLPRGQFGFLLAFEFLIVLLTVQLTLALKIHAKRRAGEAIDPSVDRPI